jgi:hypothetical protein
MSTTTSRETHTPGSFVVHCYVDFDTANRRHDGSARYKIGRGNAGWTSCSFDNAEAAIEFAEWLPPASRMPAHERAIEEFRAAIAKASQP